ncbi:DUF4181 domain-containing protein [Sporosarcina cascadiensis]|uniref:DUF4181 domain-containing protein n=1 Tax=Sporosarcina cascadiensis TaxID=2660747 RepID=UPI00129BE7BF|nr:DUF4181 domain-containing protein [Sporosarcina cascadiensis]
MVWIWMKAGLVAALTFLGMFIAQTLMRKIFDIERRYEDASSDNHINQSYRKIDKILRDYSIVIVFIVLVAGIVYFEESFNLVLIVAFILVSVRMLVKAFFEWKYSAYPKQAILTLSEMAVLFIMVIMILQTNFIP